MKICDKIKYKAQRLYFEKKVRKYIITKEASHRAFSNIIERYQNENCFIQGGLRNIKLFFNDKGGLNAFVKKFDDYFKNILVPAYTLNFKQNRVFHHQFSKPDVGGFALEFEKYAKARTLDPVSSIWIRGLNYDSFDLNSTFLNDKGLYAVLDSNKSTSFSIGTENLRLAHIHYLENKLKLPYRKIVSYNGVIYYDKYNFNCINHLTTENKQILHFERERIEYNMLKEGVLKRYDLGPLVIRVMNNEDYAQFLQIKTSKNPYYLFFENK